MIPQCELVRCSFERNANQNHNEVSSQSVRMADIKKSTKNKCWRGYEEKEPSYTFGGNANWYSHYGEQCGDSLKNWKQNGHTTQECPGHTH